jgi:Kef-type K+ transport system membrane component KefB
MDMLLKLAIVVLVGCLAGRLAKTLKLSNVFGFVIAGIILGPSCLKLLSSQDLSSLGIIAEIAVAIVAFKIGSEFVVRDMKKLGKSFVVITFSEVFGTILVVFATMYFLFKQDFAFSLVMASIAAATAPAATIMVMRQYRADGPVTRTLLPVIALDGVLGVLLFGIAISITRVVALGAEVSVWQTVGRPVIEIFGSLALGAVFGLALTFFGQKAGDSDELLVTTIAMILASTAVAKVLTLSPLLTNIMMGAVLVNLTQNSNRIFFSLNHFTPPIYLLFFTLAGARFDLRVLLQAALLGLGYLLARAFGKIFGAWLGSKAVKAEPAVQKHLGVALLPQGGLSIALAILVLQHQPDISMDVIAIIVVSVLLYEIVGTNIAKMAIQKAGEIRGMGSTIR